MSLTSYPQEVVEKSEIELHSDSIIGRTEALETQINLLAEALKSVIAPLPPEPQSIGGIKATSSYNIPSTTLGSKLAGAAGHIDRLHYTVEQLRNRCKL